MLIHRMIDKFERRIRKLEAADGEDAKTKRLAYELMLRYYQRLKNSAQGVPLCWHEGSAPWEVLDAMGVLVLNVEFLGLHAIACAPKYIDAAAALGYSADTCSRTRSSIGMCASEELPKPSFVMAQYNVCDSPIKSAQHFAHHFHCPIIYVDTPYYESEETLQYVVEEHQRAIGMMESLTGRRLDYGALRSSVEKTKRVYGLLREIANHTVAVPSPLHGRDWLRNVGLAVLCREDPLMVEYLEAMLQMVKNRVARGEGVVPNEKIRIGWLHTPPLFTDLFVRVEKEFGAAITFCEFANIFSNIYADIFSENGATEQPLLAMSKRLLRHPWQGSVKKRIDWALYLAERYKVDLCVHYSQWGCRHTSLSARMLKEALYRELGVRTIIIEGDYQDSRGYSEEDVIRRIQAFLETT